MLHSMLMVRGDLTDRNHTYIAIVLYFCDDASLTKNYFSEKKICTQWGLAVVSPPFHHAHV